jgi:probable LLM family oxidoreductase
MSALEFGLDTFGDVTDDVNGEPKAYAHVIRDIVDQAVLADQLGVDVIGLGEHHRDDFAVSSPEMVLSAIASRTTNIHLSSAVTVLSSDDPVRVFERFATLDAVSNGRAEVIVGRGSFTESFPLFGLDLHDYNLLFEERLELFAEVLKEGAITWEGQTRAALNAQHVYPKTESGSLTTWVGVGGSPESVVRAAKYGLPLTLAIIGGASDRFAPYADLYRRATEQFGHGALPIAVHSPGHIAATDEQARDELWPYYSAMVRRIGKERGWGPMTRESFEHEADSGALYVGSPATVAAKILATHEAIGMDRFDLKYSNGRMPHEKLMESIRLYGEQVIPRVKVELGQFSTPVGAEQQS